MTVSHKRYTSRDLGASPEQNGSIGQLLKHLSRRTINVNETTFANERFEGECDLAMVEPASQVEPHPSWSVTERLNWLLTQLMMAALWLGFFWFGAKIFRDSPIDEIVDSLMWLAKATWIYLLALALWIGYNIALYKWRGAIKAGSKATTVFSQDYFGRRIEIVPGATLRDSHLILEMKEGSKVYGPEKPVFVPDPEPPRGKPVLVPTKEFPRQTKRAAAG